MKKTGLRFLAACFLFIIIFACNNEEVLSKYKTISHASWHRDSLVVFQIPVIDTLQNHNLYINVRNDINYKYSNLWLFVEITQPGERKAVIDTLEVTLADERGKWLGNGFGGVKTLETLFRQNIYFPASGNYKIQIKQGMRGKQLNGITEIGIRVEKQ